MDGILITGKRISRAADVIYDGVCSRIDQQAHGTVYLIGDVARMRFALSFGLRLLKQRQEKDNQRQFNDQRHGDKDYCLA